MDRSASFKLNPDLVISGPESYYNPTLPNTPLRVGHQRAKPKIFDAEKKMQTQERTVILCSTAPSCLSIAGVRAEPRQGNRGRGVQGKATHMTSLENNCG